MTRDELFSYCLSLPDTTSDLPFTDDDSVVFRHKKSRKWFVLFYERGGKEYVNLKQDPELSRILRKSYRDLTPAWHMNKLHWNTIPLLGDVPDEEIKNQIADSFDLTLGAVDKKRVFE